MTNVIDDGKTLATKYQSWGAWRRFGAKHPNTWGAVSFAAGALVMYVIRLFV